ncbi:MAG: PBP1A family penicillin-binding protein, partial [Halanaerobiaceae bacterium]|nr:PBP1A family penicillin-binding protein [Halanaerobiaceae bacterium]
IGAIAWIIQDTPDISNYKGASEATFLYSADGQLLTKLYQQNRIKVTLDRIPINLQNAIIAIEDNSFYVHHGIDFVGTARALITNIIKQRERPHGASTITQQLAGNALLDRQSVTYKRKIQEAYLALQFERLYTKPEILEMYLNEIFLGHSAYGVQAASLQYFNKNVWELNLSECALIAGLPKGPNLYSPFRDLERSLARRDAVLDRMEELGYITPEQAREAKEYEIVLNTPVQEEEEFAPYFVRYVRDQLIDMFGAQLVYSGGLKVYTTLDPVIQKKAEQAVENAIKEKYIPTIEREGVANPIQPQLALITIDHTTGEIKAMVGGRGNDQFNRAYQAVRQPGSAFKPFVYTTAIKQGWSPASIINDMPMLAKEEKNKPLELWPTNFGNEYKGLVSLRTALKESLNVSAVKLIKEVGVEATIKTAEEMGITTLQPADRYSDRLSLALGGLNKGVTPLEMAAAYGIFANQGIWVEPHAITRVLDSNNRVLYEARPRKRVVLSEDEAYLMTSMLQSVIADAGGTGWRARLGNQPVAGKTGTTNNYTDAWFVGFTPRLVTSLWIGEDNLTPMEYNQKDAAGNYFYPEGSGGLVISSSEAARLWGEYMREVVKDMPISSFQKPANIVTVEVDPLTGLLPNQYTTKTVKEVFRKENVPTEVTTLQQPVKTSRICKESGLLATSGCPEENIIEYRHFTDNRYRLGSARINFGTKYAGSNESRKTDITGVYIVDENEPIQKIDPVTGVPETDSNGNPVFLTAPEKECDLHKSTIDSFFDNFWNFFNRFQ